MGRVRSFSFSTPELARAALRLVAIRFLLYLGAMSSYFIGILGTLTFGMDAGVGDNVIAVGLLNVLLMVGGIKGGAWLDRMGPRRHLRLCIALLVASGLLYQVLARSVEGVFLGAALFGFSWGVADVVPRSYPAYLTSSRSELSRINAALTLASNAAVVIGPLAGGAITLVAPTPTVFLFMAACAALAFVPACGFRPLRGRDAAVAEPAAGGADVPLAMHEGPSDAGRGDGDAAGAGFREIFASGILSLLFWATMLSFMGYGAFDPLESLFYRDVLKVGAEWMGWLSALAGVGGLVGALFAGMIPARHINVRSLLVVLALSGAGCLLYVSTPYVGVACVGQLALGIAFSAFGPIKDTLVQIHAPLERIGRVNAAMGVGYNLAGALPLVCAPFLARTLGVQGTLIAAGVTVALVPVAILLLRRDMVTDMVRVERERESAASSAEEASRGDA